MPQHRLLDPETPIFMLNSIFILPQNQIPQRLIHLICTHTQLPRSGVYAVAFATSEAARALFHCEADNTSRVCLEFVVVILIFERIRIESIKTIVRSAIPSDIDVLEAVVERCSATQFRMSGCTERALRDLCRLLCFCGETWRGRGGGGEGREAEEVESIRISRTFVHIDGVSVGKAPRPELREDIRYCGGQLD
ncbi:hypothetical protein BDP27DRAFT_1433390 [Rhodocollybia butyracea]|uniref:Uncharacterized protein n=1 Tax=Rhodocollybia butyracea TaxID=206335 RepID=A0A9P5TW93_9AGAR|nr:hypothetical protein BDP27DRAFT_1433390 [Rhodocollybia butyracea]